MDTPINEEREQDDEGQRDGAVEIHSRGSGLAEQDPIGPQADGLSSTGARIDTDATPEQMDIMRKGSAT